VRKLEKPKKPSANISLTCSATIEPTARGKCYASHRTGLADLYEILGGNSLKEEPSLGTTSTLLIFTKKYFKLYSWPAPEDV
jgi:hypothetical protein